MNNTPENLKTILLSDPSEQLRHPFNNKQLVFTGSLSMMTRSEAAKKVRACGGMMQGAVTKETDFIILGHNRRGVSTKQLKAEQFIRLGMDIQMISEDDFLWLISM